MHFLRATSSSSLTTTEILSAAHAASNPKHTSTSQKSGIGTKPIINCQLHTHEKDAPSSTPDSEPSIDSAPDDHLLAMVDDTLTSSPNSSDNTQLLSTNKNVPSHPLTMLPMLIKIMYIQSKQNHGQGSNGGHAGSDMNVLHQTHNRENENSLQKLNRQHNDRKVTSLGSFLGVPVELSNGIADKTTIKLTYKGDLLVSKLALHG